MSATEMQKMPETTEASRTERTRSGRVYRPNVDIVESKDELTLMADLPGVRGEDVDIRFENGTLTIHGHVSERGPRDGSYMMREYGIGDFYRSFEVSESINSEAISAEQHDGVLIVHLPKVEAMKPRKITVKTS